MLNFIKQFFRPLTEKLIIGKTYIFISDDGNPFAKKAHKVKIIAIRNGFVKFDRGRSFDSMTVNSFKNCFTLHKD